jgi:hypothetical protein
MASTTTQLRNEAIERGMEFIYRTACDPEHFASYGYDYLCCFCCIASTSKHAKLRRLARDMGRERAVQWRKENAHVPSDAGADDIAYLVFGSDAADRLGIRDQRFKDEIRKASLRFNARDYFEFDPANEPPPDDVPDECECEEYNPRGSKRCRECRKELTMMSRYGVWVDALTRSYTGERYGVCLGATFADVIKWLPNMRPYPNYEEGDNVDSYWAIYAVTHVVYTLNDYSSYSLSPRSLPQEFAFLKSNLEQAIVMEDPETMGEVLDTLKSFGLSEDDPLILKGVNYLLAQQNSDGSWGDVDAEDIYQRHHPTWTAIDGLREYAWQGKRVLRNFRPLKLNTSEPRSAASG